MKSFNRELIRFLRAVKAAAPFPDQFKEFEQEAICDLVGIACLVDETVIAIGSAKAAVILVSYS